MTAKQKAFDLIDKFIRFHRNGIYNVIHEDIAKQYALIAVNLHLEELSKMKLIFSDREIHYKYWQEVKQEIEKL